MNERLCDKSNAEAFCKDSDQPVHHNLAVCYLAAEDLNCIHADSNESDQIKRMPRLILDFINIGQRLSDLSSIRCP